MKYFHDYWEGELLNRMFIYNILVTLYFAELLELIQDVYK